MAGRSHTWFILSDDGRLFSAGSNKNGLLGQPHLRDVRSSYENQLWPVLVGERVTQVATGNNCVLVRTAGPITVESKGKVATLGPARKYGWHSQGKGTVARIPIETTTLGPDRWYGWGSNVTGQLLLPDQSVYPPTHIPQLDGVVDLWCGSTVCFAMMQRADRSPILCEWGNSVMTEPSLIPGFHELATAEGLRVLRITTSLFTVCLLASEDCTRSVVLKWGSWGNEFLPPEQRSSRPRVIYDSATAVGNPDGSPCVAVDAYTFGGYAILMTSQRRLLVRSFLPEQAELGWLPVAPVGEERLEAVLVGSAVGTRKESIHMMLVDEDGELYTNKREARWPAIPLSVHPGGQYYWHEIAPVPRDQLPSDSPARVPGLPWGPHIQMEAFVGAWLVARRKWLPHNDLAGVPRDIARILADYVRTSFLPVLPPPASEQPPD